MQQIDLELPEIITKFEVKDVRITYLCLLMVALVGIAGCSDVIKTVSPIKNEIVQIASGNRTYPAYLAVPNADGKWPGVVLIHSFNGLEPGYKTLVNKFASDGFAVIAPEWQTFNQTPSDEIVGQLIKDSVAYLMAMKNFDANNLGLTDFALAEDTPCSSCLRWSSNQELPSTAWDKLPV